MGLGSFALATSAVGCFAPGFGPRLVAVFLGVSGVLAFLQVVLVLGLFGAQARIADAIAQTDTTGRYTQCVSQGAQLPDLKTHSAVAKAPGCLVPYQTVAGTARAPWWYAP